jgi:hypothetical protein
MTIRSDEQGRLACAELFPPNNEFTVQRQEDGSLRVEPVSKPTSRLVQPVLTSEGFLMVPARLNNREISSAIRAAHN